MGLIDAHCFYCNTGNRLEEEKYLFSKCDKCGKPLKDEGLTVLNTAYKGEEYYNLVYYDDFTRTVHILEEDFSLFSIGFPDIYSDDNLILAKSDSFIYEILGSMAAVDIQPKIMKKVLNRKSRDLHLSDYSRRRVAFEELFGRVKPELRLIKDSLDIGSFIGFVEDILRNDSRRLYSKQIEDYKLHTWMNRERIIAYRQEDIYIHENGEVWREIPKNHELVYIPFLNRMENNFF